MHPSEALDNWNCCPHPLVGLQVTIEEMTKTMKTDTYKITLTTLIINQTHSQHRTLTQHDMLPQHPVNIMELSCECF